VSGLILRGYGERNNILTRGLAEVIVPIVPPVGEYVAVPPIIRYVTYRYPMRLRVFLLSYMYIRMFLCIYFTLRELKKGYLNVSRKIKQYLASIGSSMDRGLSYLSSKLHTWSNEEKSLLMLGNKKLGVVSEALDESFLRLDRKRIGRRANE